MAGFKDGLKVLSFGFKDISLVALNTLMHEHDSESHEFREAIESELVYLCTFALEDPIRGHILETCNTIKYGTSEKDE